ncbi:MAG: putative signal transducing protein [Flavobacteriales bacterium]
MPLASDWVMVYEAASRTEAELVRGRLEEHGVPAIVIDQGAHPYPQLANAQVHVRKDDAVRALYIVRQPPEA